VKVHRSIASYHRDPGTERAGVAQGVQLPQRVQKNILHHIFDFVLWQARQKDPMHQRRVKLVKAAKQVAIASEYSSDERRFKGFRGLSRCKRGNGHTRLMTAEAWRRFS
jgi:hypothetical protein